jgi:hypothetical protein
VRPGGVWLATLGLLAIALGRAPEVFDRPTVFGRAPLGRVFVGVRVAVLGRFVVAGRDVVELRGVDGVELRAGAVVCEDVPCEGVLFAGALGLLGLLGSFLCWASANTGTAIIKKNIADLRSIFASLKIRFITASWPSNFPVVLGAFLLLVKLPISSNP